MILPRLFLWLLTLAGVSLIALMPPPVLAEDVPCETLSDTIAMIESHGGELVDLIDVRSDHLDQIVIVVMGGRLTVGGVKDGCLATPPIPMDSVEPVTPA